MKISTIRFNLKFFNADGGEEVVRTLDDLRSKFNLSDLYDYFKAGDLSRWLTSINRPELADAIAQSACNADVRSQVLKLRDILNLPLETNEIEQFVAFWERQNQLREKKNNPDSAPKVGKSYIELVNDVFDAEDFQSIKERLAVIADNSEYEYRFLNDLRHICVDYDLGKGKVLLAVFGHEKWRKYLYYTGWSLCIAVKLRRADKKSENFVFKFNDVVQYLDVDAFESEIPQTIMTQLKNAQKSQYISI